MQSKRLRTGGGDIGARAFAAARRMVGVRFRPQGFDVTSGVDCVGLVWAAHAAVGRRLVRPRDYPMRGWSRERIAEALTASGFALVEDAPRAGDVALIALAAGQFHLGLMGQTSFVHAHAGLRRVVETPVDEGLSDAVFWRLGLN